MTKKQAHQIRIEELLDLLLIEIETSELDWYTLSNSLRGKLIEILNKIRYLEGEE